MPLLLYRRTSYFNNLHFLQIHLTLNYIAVGAKLRDIHSSKMPGHRCSIALFLSNNYTKEYGTMIN